MAYGDHNVIVTVPIIHGILLLIYKCPDVEISGLIGRVE